MGEGRIYPRGDVLWLRWYDELGIRWRRSSGCRVGQEDEAQAVLDAILRKVAAKRRVLKDADVTDGVLTVAAYRKRWIADRTARGVASAKDDDARLTHAMPTIGQLAMSAVRALHIRDLVRELRSRVGPKKADLAPKTARHVYFVLRQMFSDAVTEEIIPANPCVVKRGELPAREDKDPEFRSRLKYKRAEVEQLICSPEVPEERRVLYALLFLAGLRIGEAAARRWRDYDTESEPLGRLIVGSSYNRKRKLFKAPKRGRGREVPVHPTLARILAEWKLSGWQRAYGHPPKDDDLMFVAARGGPIKDCSLRDQLQVDLAVVGLPPHRTHDTRHTFISLCRDDGADKETLRVVTHGGKGDQLDEYTHFSWRARCAEVAKLRVSLREGRVLPLRQAAGGELTQADTAGLNTLTSGDKMHAQGGTRSVTESVVTVVGHPESIGIQGASVGGARGGSGPNGADCVSCASDVEALCVAARAAVVAGEPRRAAVYLRQALEAIEAGR